MSKIWDALKKAELERDPLIAEPEGETIPRLLSGRQRAALEAMLAHGTLDAASAACGISRKTLERWLKTPGFVAAYQAASRAAFGDAAMQLKTASQQAAAVLRGALQDGEPALRVRAAEAIVNAASRLELAAAIAQAARRERSKR
jgi:hypothetical protein